jgi:hypothetical protein
MAETAVTAAEAAPRQMFGYVTALACALAAFVFLGMPGFPDAHLALVLPMADPATGWFPAMHLLASGAIVAGGAWFLGVLQGLQRPGVIPLLTFAIFQFALLAVAVTNMAILSAGLRVGGGEAWISALFALPAIAALLTHTNFFVTVLRLRSWTHSMTVSALGPVQGGALAAFTVAVNLVPLSLTFQSMTTHAIAMVSALYRRAVIEPGWYAQSVWEQTLTVSAPESLMATAAFGLSAVLGGLWSIGRASARRQEAAAQGIAAQLNEAQTRFVADAVPAVVAAVSAHASRRRFVIWTSFWMLVAAPALLAAAYGAFRWFDVLQEQHALSWATAQASDFAAFAAGESGLAQYTIPVALIVFALSMSGPVARLFLPGARYDHLAFGTRVEEVVQTRLQSGVAAGQFGPGQPFDPNAFAERITRRRYWVTLPLVLTALALAVVTGFRDLGRGIVFTGDGVIAQDHYFAPPKLIRYYEIQAIALDCRIGPLGGRPVYELTLPGGRVVDMVGSAPLSERLDQYIAVDQRLQFSGVGYAYPPGDLQPCLAAVQKQYNSLIAAGTARLLHVLD